jgi:hypothetical protein
MFAIRTIRIFLALLLAALLCSTAAAQVKVRGYTRKDGTYVRPHVRSNPDGNFANNWSTKGNINPYTGKTGTRVTPPAGYGGNGISLSSNSYRRAIAACPACNASRGSMLASANLSPSIGDQLDGGYSDSFYLDLQSAAELEQKRKTQLAQQRRDAEQERRAASRQALPVKEYTPEERAKSKFTAAHMLYKAGNVDASKNWLAKILDEHPSTPTAGRARLVLAKF